MAARRRLKAQEVADALTASRGLVGPAARALGCDRSTIYRWRDRSVTVRQAMDDARESMTDLAEGALFKQISQGEAWAVQFYLKTQGRHRGYIDRRELQHSLQSLTDAELLAIAGGDALDDDPPGT